MKQPRGSCPECQLRDVSHHVTTQHGEEFDRCKLCSDSYAFPDVARPIVTQPL